MKLICLFFFSLCISISLSAQKMTKEGQIVAALDKPVLIEHTETVPDTVIVLTDFQEKELMNYSKIITEVQEKQNYLIKLILDAKNKNDYEVKGYQPGKLIVKKK